MRLDYLIISIMLIISFISAYGAPQTIYGGIGLPNIYVQKDCSYENLAFRITENNEPASGILVKLYSHIDGRKLISEAYANNAGYVFFSPKPEGEYDVVAVRQRVKSDEKIGFYIKRVFYTQEYYKDQREEFFVEQPRFFSEKDYLKQKEDANKYGQVLFRVAICPKKSKNNGVIDIVRNESRKFIFVDNEDNFSREFFKIILPDGKVGVRVYLRIKNISDRNFSVIETIPRSAIVTFDEIGYENRYPDYINNNENQIGWDIDNREFRLANEISRSYVITREITPKVAKSFKKLKFNEEKLEEKEDEKKGGNNLLIIGIFAVGIIVLIILAIMVLVAIKSED